MTSCRAILKGVWCECVAYGGAVWLIAELNSEQANILRGWDFPVPNDNAAILRIDKYVETAPPRFEFIDGATYHMNIRAEVVEFEMQSRGKKYPVRVISAKGIRILED